MFPVQPQLAALGYPVSDAPVWGVEFNEALARASPGTTASSPTGRVPDGSVTNW